MLYGSQISGWGRFQHFDFQRNTNRMLHAVRGNSLFDRLSGFSVLDVVVVFGGAGDHFPAGDFDLPHDFFHLFVVHSAFQDIILSHPIEKPRQTGRWQCLSSANSGQSGTNHYSSQSNLFRPINFLMFLLS